jgi:hypothetical protein
MSDIPASDSPPIPPLASGLPREPAPSPTGSPSPLVLAAAPPRTALSPEKRAAQTRLETRTWCTFIFLTCAAMIAVGLRLHPDLSGTGTHQQLGFPPCGLMQTTGVPCPTCGCTTAVTHFVHGHLLTAFITQPFGFAVGLLAVVLLPLTLYGAITGIWKGPSMFVLGWYWRYWVYGSLAIFIFAWVYKVIAVQMHLAG